MVEVRWASERRDHKWAHLDSSTLRRFLRRQLPQRLSIHHAKPTLLCHHTHTHIPIN